jgi:hypothetical protein
MINTDIIENKKGDFFLGDKEEEDLCYTLSVRTELLRKQQRL